MGESPASRFGRPDDGQAGNTLAILKRELRHPHPPELWYQLSEIVERRVYLRHGIEVREGDVVFDVGANVGVAAAFFAHECGAGAVHSFEPVGPIFEQLHRNLRHFPTCIPHPYGLSSRTRTAEVAYYPETGRSRVSTRTRGRSGRSCTGLCSTWAATEEEAAERLRGRLRTVQVECEFRALSDVLRAESIDRVDLLKIDVEKAELDVLAGIRDDDWPAIRQVAAEVHLERNGRRRVADMLAGMRFRVTIDQDPTMKGTPIHMLYAVRS